MLAQLLLLASASGYVLHPHAPTRHSSLVSPVIRAAQPAAATVSARPVSPPLSSALAASRPESVATPDDIQLAPLQGLVDIQSLTTVPELEEAMAASKAAGRLCVVKFYAPWCSACRVIQPKFQRLARDNPAHDYFQVDFSKCKPLSKHCDITALPTGIILSQGKLVEHSSIRRADFKAF